MDIKLNNYIKNCWPYSSRVLLKCFLFTSITLLICCAGIPAGADDYNFSFNQNSDYWPTESWRKSTPEKQGVNSKLLTSLVEEVNNKKEAINSILIIRNGYIILEADKGDIAQLRPLNSSTKSVTSAIIGLAISQGIIDGPDQPINDFFQLPTSTAQQSGFANLTLKHHLTMTSGTDWQELGKSYMHPENPVYQMHMSDNWSQHILNQRIITEPGTKFNYNSGSSHLLLASLAQKGLDVEDFAYKNLFQPLGILKDLYIWSTDPQNIPNGSHGLVMTPRDMAKIGYLFLKGGSWEGRQLISKHWIAESTNKQIEVNWDGKIAKYYGYQWYIQPYGFHSMGYQGQFIFILPDLDVVAVITSELSTHELEIPIKLIEKFIFATIDKEKQLPANAKAFKQLSLQIDIFNSISD